MRKLLQTNYQLYIGIVIGLICSLCLTEIFRGSIIIVKTSESGKESEFISERNFVSTIPSKNSSRHGNVKVPGGKESEFVSERNIASTIPGKKRQGNIRVPGGMESEFVSERNIVSTIPSKKHHDNIRVLCFVLTYPKNHRTQAIHVKRTWGKRCDKLLFISSQEDSAIGSIAVDGAGDGRDWLWGKTRAALKYAWERHKDEFDWIMKADDDTYVIVENLKKFLSNYSTSDPIYFGCQFSSEQIPSWPSGGAGYVLSKEALRRFVLDGLPQPKICREDPDGAEDAELGKCLSHVGVTFADSRDSLGRHRFLPFKPVNHLFPRTLGEADKNDRYWKDLTYPQVQGMDCCANDAISYHYIDNREMYELEYFLYHIRPAGVGQEQQYIQEYPLEFPEVTSTSAKPK